ncbi:MULTISPECIES: hypothetical protein [Pseudomonas]|jgi:hypothetical protein|uniref:hypothetical protein n=1 Tax=Pseudomonas TaxID=286 RepID=UPI000F565E17|nr:MULTISPECIES: hypothetical protein [Pseudomonas]AZF65715.1 hypothetical protein C4J83_4748 [Pseudomonas sp. LBUM920]MBT0623735.1 hypothetical protein [Pseudomonas fluorescens]QJI13452.1 hypothetical protein HKK58_13235 [Pseudomonas sp. ADAK22]
MTIGAITSMLPMVAGLAQEGLKAVTELAKAAGQMAQSQSGNKQGEGDQNKIAHEAMHNKERVNFSNSESTNSTVNINVA